jgi:AcrR family transcriptional regulator
MSEVRARRSSTEVRNLMLEAAHKLFHSKGFDATSTREISVEAGVSESMLFRHFGSKQAIFNEAVLQPFADFVKEFVTDWMSDRRRGPERIAHRYVSGLFELCRNHLDVITTLSATGTRGDDAQPSVDARLLIHDQLEILAGHVGRYHADAGSRPGLDPQLSVRFAIAMVVGVAQLGEDFFGIGDRLTTELADFVVRGAGTAIERPSE